MLLLTLLQVMLGCALLWGVSVTPAHAGTLYRCAGSQGETVFSSTTVGYKDCKQVASFANAAPHSGPRKAESKEATSLAWVTGWAETTAQPMTLLVASTDKVEDRKSVV